MLVCKIAHEQNIADLLPPEAGINVISTPIIVKIVERVLSEANTIQFHQLNSLSMLLKIIENNVGDDNNKPSTNNYEPVDDGQSETS